MLIFFIIGFLAGIYALIPTPFLKYSYIEYFIYTLLLIVGIGLGSDNKSLALIKNIKPSIIFIPIVSLFGTAFGVLIISLLLPSLGLKEILAAGLGMGYYSIPSIIVTKFSGEIAGAIVLIANMLRELLTLLISPLLARYLGNLAPIAAGGATTGDITLPIITKASGKEYVFIAIINGMILSILVPLLVTFIIQ